jgi:hypothetical protein
MLYSNIYLAYSHPTTRLTREVDIRVRASGYYPFGHGVMRGNATRG